ncbi:hypothetical protein [Polycladomyces subterraneus]|uniref:Uncharacterized protein n=1 Tax=Polycladomyces subterraneus TaxID=1016997 RepID=A0ABT8IJM5_9BACL|nr:hypothetical protein [Polycladomyces subterraneus]MDN4592983.1 hypothetical protein [Polycladomyces subterraneus]
MNTPLVGSATITMAVQGRSTPIISVYLSALPIYEQTQQFPLGCKKGDKVGFGWLWLALAAFLLIFLLVAN